MVKKVGNLLPVYKKLYKKYGPQAWWPTVSDNPEFEVMIGAILTQNTSWQNVKKAIANLIKARVLDSSKILTLPLPKLQKLVKPSGYYRMKAKKLKALCCYLRATAKNHQTDKQIVNQLKTQPLKKLRTELLAIYGIGPETADSILCYALVKPAFVVDAYTFRFCRQVLKRNFKSYESCQAFFLANLPRSVKLYNEFHALVVRWGVARRQKKCRHD